MSSSSEDSDSDNGNGNGGDYGARRGGDFEGPSASRRRAINDIWPEPFLEALATQVAIDASRSIGRLAAAQAVANVFQVCSTWRAVSRSEMLWSRLTRVVWGRTHLMLPTWHEEYIYRHRVARSFRTRRSSHYTLHYDPSDVDDPDGLICRCLTLSDLHLACGFADGTVRLFDLATRLHVSTFRPHHRDDRIGRFSRAVSGIVINDSTLVFATLDGDIHVAVIDGGAQPPRRAHLGDVVNDGALVDFTGCGRFWVGLYAGPPGRAFHVWDSNTEEVVFVDGSLTDPEAVMGWRMLTELTESVGRIRVTSLGFAVACTSSRVMVFDLRNPGLILGEREYPRGLIVTCADVSEEGFIVVDSRGVARVRRVDTFEEVCRFPARGASVGCMNSGYAMVCAGGVIRVWEVDRGEYLYSFRERVGEVNALVANERHVAGCAMDSTIHLWDFGAQ
ncbi:WD40 domain-containing protein [Cephalotus follicularis]|uniref:WD40 domain-containing protein n=1 Tax=Cephalotus follicularis TaxID=3775 RepID=A0A1Q3D2V3_CEPFO|nr:WD40 domain-containing protein [Cephalotus follicularis]